MSKASNYLVCVIVENGHRRVFSPDFDIHFVVPLSNDPHKWTALTLQQMENEIQTRLNRLKAEGHAPPAPKNWREVVSPVPKDLITVEQTAELLQCSPSTLRRKDFIKPYRTPGGTRRYSMKDVQQYLMEAK